jgi:hypothetical protein
MRGADPFRPMLDLRIQTSCLSVLCGKDMRWVSVHREGCSVKEDLELKGMSAENLAVALIGEITDGIAQRQQAAAKTVVIELLRRWSLLNRSDTSIVKDVGELADKYEKLTTVMAPDVAKEIRAALNPPCAHPAATIEVQEKGSGPLFVCGACGKRLKITEFEWV